MTEEELEPVMWAGVLLRAVLLPLLWGLTIVGLSALLLWWWPP